MDNNVTKVIIIMRWEIFLSSDCIDIHTKVSKHGTFTATCIITGNNNKVLSSDSIDTHTHIKENMAYLGLSTPHNYLCYTESSCYIYINFLMMNE